MIKIECKEGDSMFPVDKEDIFVKRTREHLKLEVSKFRTLGRSDVEIIRWIEDELMSETDVTGSFDSAHEMAEFLDLPLSKFSIFWM